MLSIVVLYSFASLLLMSGSLFLFILARRLLVESQERKDLRVFLEMERELLEVLTAPSPSRAAVEFARKHGSRSRGLKRLLVAYREALAGQALEPLKVIFERTIRARCLRDLPSRWLAWRRPT